MYEAQKSDRSRRNVVCTILGVISLLGIVCMLVDVALLLADALILAPPAFVREGVRFLQSWSFWSSSHGGLFGIASLFLLIYLVPQFIMRLFRNNECPKWLMHASIALLVPVLLLVLSYCVITFTGLELPIPHAKVTLADSAEAAQVGEAFTLGSYEQDANKTGGSEPIEWIVLEKEADRMLVISRYALDWQNYDTYNDSTGQSIPTTWEDSAIRTWLNSSFYNEAFTSDEKARILTTTLTTDADDTSDSVCVTEDRIFLLSKAEAAQYFSTDNARICQATAHAYYVCYRTTKGSGVRRCRWWLRANNSWAYVSDYGELDFTDSYLYEYNAVRPAMWVSLSD